MRVSARGAGARVAKIKLAAPTPRRGTAQRKKPCHAASSRAGFRARIFSITRYVKRAWSVVFGPWKRDLEIRCHRASSLGVFMVLYTLDAGDGETCQENLEALGLMHRLNFSR